ncbi:hypothetical protein SAMN05428949_5460 [Chitinophaga sp. YR627]|uniref:hypothetical protein n=1 Tax=Chitinophaga sp. YR627 TaxID=1881041 RepID=UPI0008E4D8F7|nr:hypothetical protein [Chitinophaga sp. YR627]SFO50340.1 hypothetical protein SAMN05428949_5460 [Chitinophaga sp. YR627]
MARQKSIILLTGKLGDKIGYQRNGKYFFRSTPQTVRQSSATRRASKRFGIYSTQAKSIRHAFYPDLDIQCDSTHVNRLNKLLIKSAGDHTAIKGFRFNKQTGIDRFLKILPEFSRNGMLHIPPQHINNEGFTALEIKAIAVRIDFSSRRVTGTDTVNMLIDPQQPFCGANIPLYVSGEGTLLLTIQIRGIDQGGLTRNRQYTAADIIAVLPPIRPKRFRAHTHPLRTITQLHPALPSLHVHHQTIAIQKE